MRSNSPSQYFSNEKCSKARLSNLIYKLSVPHSSNFHRQNFNKSCFEKNDMRLMFYFCQFEWTPLSPTPSPQKHCIAPSQSPSLPQSWLDEKGHKNARVRGLSSGPARLWGSGARSICFSPPGLCGSPPGQRVGEGAGGLEGRGSPQSRKLCLP